MELSSLRPENYTYGERNGFSPGYEGMDANLDEVDIFFIYPWPGEQEFVLEFFQAVAADGALCLIYLGDDEFGLVPKNCSSVRLEAHLHERRCLENNFIVLRRITGLWIGYENKIIGKDRIEFASFKNLKIADPF